MTSTKTTVLERQRDDAGRPQQEPTTPPTLVTVSVDHQEQRQAQVALSPTSTLSQADILAHAAKLLVEIAGSEPVHIEMSPRGPKKYYEVKRPITEQDSRAHLKGWKTKGAYLRRPDGMTRALCYDADTSQDWQHLLDAARFLAEAGYRPIVEDSPAGRGGHLWILYSGLVKATWAHRHALEVAPMLHQIEEAWPGSGPNKVRLPGGAYVKPGLATWCKLHDAHRVRIAEDGQSAARVLLDYQTPAELVPAYPEPRGQGPDAEHLPDIEHQAQSKNEQSTAQTEPWLDARWQQQYGRSLWFHFTPAQLAAWYNERTQVHDLLPPAHNGMGLASWRGEHTASVGLREAGWVDFGASARRSDGKQDGGDALELTVRMTEEPKPEVMRQVARQLVSEVRAAMEQAALHGEQPPHWVQTFMSPAGWERYHQLRAVAGQRDRPMMDNQELTAYIGGVAGSCATSPAQAVPHARAKDTPEALAAEIGATLGELCKQCGCSLRYESGPYVMCHKCHPRPLRAGGLNDEQWERLRRLFPRKTYELSPVWATRTSVRKKPQ